MSKHHPLRSTLLSLFQAAITCGVMAYLLRDGERRREMAGLLSQAHGGWIAAGLAVYGVVEWLAAWRWKRLLRVQGVRVSTTRLFALTLIGVFYNFFTPGGTGGDLVRALYVLKESPQRKTVAVLSIIVDRIAGLFALILLAAVFIGWNWHWLTSTPLTRSYVWITLLLLALSVGAVAFSAAASGRGWVEKLPMHFPGRLRIAETARAYHAYACAWPALIAAVFTSLISHLGYIAVFYCAARALATPTLRMPSWTELCTIMPVVNTITALPISLGGLGVREGLFQVFLHQLAGVEKSAAVVVSSLGFLLTAFWGGVGGIINAAYRPTASPP